MKQQTAVAGYPGSTRTLLDKVLAVLDWLTALDGWLGAFCLALLTLLMIAGAAVRSLAGLVPSLPPDIPWAWEYSAYLMAATFTFGAAMTLRRGGHLRVNLLRNRFGPEGRRRMEILASAAGAAFVCYFAWAFIAFTYGTYRLGEKSGASETALWVPQAVVAFGIALLALQMIARCVRAALHLPVETPPSGTPE